MSNHFRNSLWMITENGLRIFSNVISIFFIARYLGPELFGTISYAIGITSIALPIARLGMESILVKEIVESKYGVSKLISNAFSLMQISAFFLYFFIIFAVWISIGNADVVFLCVAIILSGVFFQSALVVDYAFQAKVNSKISAIAKTLAIFLGVILKLLVVIFGANIYIVALVFSLDHFFVAIALFVVNKISLKEKVCFLVDGDITRQLLKNSIPMAGAALATILYQRIDQIMIMNMLGATPLGVYSAAIKIYEGFSTVFYVAAVSTTGILVGAYKKNSEEFLLLIYKIYRYFFVTAMLCSIFCFVFSDIIIDIIYGSAFSDAADVLVLVLFALPLSVINTINARYYVTLGLAKKFMARVVSALLINVALNFVLIEKYGLAGACYSTIVALFFSSLIYDFFDKQTRDFAVVKFKVLFFLR